MHGGTVEINIGYKDYFVETYTINYQELDDLIQSLSNDEKEFIIGDKKILRKDLNSVSIVNHGLGFIFTE